MEFESQNESCQNKKFSLILSLWIEVWNDGFICTLLYLALFSKSFNLCQVENSFADFLDKKLVLEKLTIKHSLARYTKNINSDVYIVS